MTGLHTKVPGVGLDPLLSREVCPLLLLWCLSWTSLLASDLTPSLGHTAAKMTLLAQRTCRDAADGEEVQGASLSTG